ANTFTSTIHCCLSLTLYFKRSNSSLNYSYSLFTQSPAYKTYTLSLHDALPIFVRHALRTRPDCPGTAAAGPTVHVTASALPRIRSEEHTSELQSLRQLVCRLLLEKKKTASKIELLEETGYAATRWKRLLRFLAT